MVDTLWQVVAAYGFALIGGGISTSLQLKHKQLCASHQFRGWDAPWRDVFRDFA